MIPVDCDMVCICSKIPKITTKKLKNLINQVSKSRKFSHKPEESRRKKLEESKYRENNKRSDLILNTVGSGHGVTKVDTVISPISDFNALLKEMASLLTSLLASENQE